MTCLAINDYHKPEIVKKILKGKISIFKKFNGNPLPLFSMWLMGARQRVWLVQTMRGAALYR